MLFLALLLGCAAVSVAAAAPATKPHCTLLPSHCGLVVVFQKNNGVCRVGSQCDNLMGFFCGEGKFCCPDQPPRMHRRDTEEPESQSLLDYTGASGHL